MSTSWKYLWRPPRKARSATSDIFRETRTPKQQWYADRSLERYRRRPDALPDDGIMSGVLGTYENITFVTHAAMPDDTFIIASQL